jgi:hypothetical protein
MPRRDAMAALGKAPIVNRAGRLGVGTEEGAPDLDLQSTTVLVWRVRSATQVRIVLPFHGRVRSPPSSRLDGFVSRRISN